MLDGRGFLARFLYVNIPPAAAPRSFQSAPIPQDVQEDYRELIRGLLNLPPKTDIALRLLPEAIELMEGVCNGLEQYLIHEARDMREWGSKLIGFVLRIAGLIHVSAGLTGDISADTIRRAICIGRYAFQHAMYAYSIIGADETVEKALHVVSRLRKHRIRDISQSALYQLCRGRFFRDAKELEPAMELLEQHGYIWRDTPLYSGVGRPPSLTILCEPDGRPRTVTRLFCILAFLGGELTLSHFAIMRFSKYKGPEISRIEAHNERTKETYASNPDIDTSRTHLNTHLTFPSQHYRAEAERQIREANCRVRSDSIRLVEVPVLGQHGLLRWEVSGRYPRLLSALAGLPVQPVEPKYHPVCHHSHGRSDTAHACGLCAADAGSSAQRQGGFWATAKS